MLPIGLAVCMHSLPAVTAVTAVTCLHVLGWALGNSAEVPWSMTIHMSSSLNWGPHSKDYSILEFILVYFGKLPHIRIHISGILLGEGCYP